MAKTIGDGDRKDFDETRRLLDAIGWCIADQVKFLRARLDEDEAAAKPQADWLREYEKRPGDWARFMSDPVIGPFGGQSPLRDVARGLYVGRMADPDRVLREVEAKRAHIRMWETFAVNFTHVDETVFEFAKREALEDVLAADAAAYSDHPDYRTERNGN